MISAREAVLGLHTPAVVSITCQYLASHSGAVSSLADVSTEAEAQTAPSTTAVFTVRPLQEGP